MTDITFIVPFSPSHSMIVERAVASVRKQTVPCEIIVQRDTDMRGPGYARNRALERVQTPMTVFLDADDTVAPNFAEVCLNAMKTNHYVYTDWYDGQGAYGRAPTPCKVWTEKTFHLVTTLLFTEDVRRIGGFDEALPGAEDTDFGLRLRLSGVCGVHIAQALVMYQPGGARSNALHNSAEDSIVQNYFTERYGGFKLMGCCGPDVEVTLPLNERQTGDVMMIANWAGNKPYTGSISGRRYGDRVGNFRPFWVDPQDAAAQPSFWRKPSEQEIQRTVLQPQYQAMKSTREGNMELPWQQSVNAIFGGGQAPQAPSKPIEYKPNTPGLKKGDTLKKAAEWTKVEGSDL